MNGGSLQHSDQPEQVPKKMIVHEQHSRDEEHEKDDDLGRADQFALRLVQLTFFISLSVAMRKSALVGLLISQKTSTA